MVEQTAGGESRAKDVQNGVKMIKQKKWLSSSPVRVPYSFMFKRYRSE